MRFLIFAFLFPLFSFAGPWGYYDGDFSIDASGGMYSSKENYNGEGIPTSLGKGAEDKKIFEINSDFGARYDFSNDFSTYLKSDFRRTLTSDGYFERVTAAVPTVTPGLDYLYWQTFIDFIFDLSADIPIGTVDENGDDAIVSDGTLGVTPKLYFAKNFFKSYRTFFGIGYQYRGNDFSHNQTWEYFIGKPQGTINFGIGIWGYRPVTRDGKSDARKKLLTTVNGGSFKYYAPDSRINNAEAFLGISLLPFIVKIGAISPLSGANVSKGMDFYASLSMIFRTGPEKTSQYEKYQKEEFDSEQPIKDEDVFNDPLKDKKKKKIQGMKPITESPSKKSPKKATSDIFNKKKKKKK